MAVEVNPSRTGESCHINWQNATHALVCFEEENRLAVVPVNRIKLYDKDVQIGSTCSVLWSNRKVYDATLILTGSQVECDRKLEIEESWSSDSDDEIDNVQNDDMQKVDEQSDDMKGIAGNEVPEKSVYEEKREKEQVQKMDDKMSTPVGRKPAERKRKLIEINKENKQPKQPKRDKKKESNHTEKVTKKDKKDDFELFVGVAPAPPNNSSLLEIPSKIHTVVVDDGKSDRCVDPVHYIDGTVSKHHKEVMDLLNDMKTTVNELKAEQATQLQSIKNDVANISTKLDSFHGTTSMEMEPGQSSTQQNKRSSPMETQKLAPVPSPVTSIINLSTSQSVSVGPTVPETPPANRPFNHSEDSLLALVPANEEEVVDSSVELLSPSVLTPIFVRSCSRRNFAAKLVAKLFDRETRLRSNVNGRGKDQLDTEKISYVKKKSFEYYPLNGGEKEPTEWQLCIISIDESNRRLKKSVKKEPLMADDTCQ